MLTKWINIILIIMLSVFVVACKKDVETFDPLPLVMVTQPVKNSEQFKSYSGEVQARQQIVLAFRVSGQLLSRAVDVGDRVKTGQVLAKLDPKDSEIQLNSAMANLQQAQSAVELAEIQLKRYQALLPDNAVSQAEFDNIENQYKIAVSKREQAQDNVNTVKNQLQYNQLISEKNGIITQRNVDVGQVISAGQTVYQLAVDGERDVVIGIAEKDIEKVKIGQPASVVLWSNPEQKLTAKVREIAPAMDSSHTYQVKVSVNSSTPLQLGQTARVFFQENTQGQFNVPLTAVSEENKQTFVWKLKPDQTLTKIPVKVVEYGKTQASLSSGVTVNDWIVMAGVHLVREQQKVNPVDTNNRAVILKNAEQPSKTNKTEE